MKDLISIKIENDQQLLSARDLHKGLGLKRKFTDWVKQNFKDFEEGFAIMSSGKSGKVVMTWAEDEE